MAAPSVRTNSTGYETKAPKVAVVQDSAKDPGATSFEVLNAAKTAVFQGVPGAVKTVPGWTGYRFQSLDFSSFSDTGLFTVRVLPSGAVSDTFRIGDARLFRTAASAVVGYFTSMRNTEAGDRKMGYFDQPERGTRDVYGGWSDALGDNGKYLSHLSYANFMNPQQIPMVLWSLLRSKNLAGARSAGIPFDDESTWGADYLLRVQDPAGYFYINVFNEGWSGARTICTWIGDADKQGVPTSDYQAAWREGGGMSIAALALASRLGLKGDSTSAQYLAGAKRGYAHLAGSYAKWADDGRENLIDHTTALLAATELALATGEAPYATAARARVDSILARQSPQGWFYADNGSRVWYHGADEGLPQVAMVRYLALDSTSATSVKIKASLAASLAWYTKITHEVANPFTYPRAYVPFKAPVQPGVANLAKGKPGFASTVQNPGQEASKALDGDPATRWSSNLQDSLGWIGVDLGSVYKLESVSVLWEAAHAKKYDIQGSMDSLDWTTIATDGVTGAGRKTTAIAGAPSARYVRLKGVTRSSPSYSYSIYEFEVYGAPDTPPVLPQPGKTTFFMPHQNETGYWWQGENARLGSLATAFAQSQQVLDPTWRLSADDTISRMVVGALEWVGGSNPLGISFIEGFGPKNPPGYMGKANLLGGIVNGITSSIEDETHPTFMPYANPADWKNWRWNEQWLPHDAWYLMGIATIANAQERVLPLGVHRRTTAGPRMAVNGLGGRLEVLAVGARSIELRTLQGRLVARVEGPRLVWTGSHDGLLVATAQGSDWTANRMVQPLR